jgi:hypothetical protein
VTSTTSADFRGSLSLLPLPRASSTATALAPEPERVTPPPVPLPHHLVIGPGLAPRRRSRTRRFLGWFAGWPLAIVVVIVGGLLFAQLLFGDSVSGDIWLGHADGWYKEPATPPVTSPISSTGSDDSGPFHLDTLGSDSAHPDSLSRSGAAASADISSGPGSALPTSPRTTLPSSLRGDTPSNPIVSPIPPCATRLSVTLSGDGGDGGSSSGSSRDSGQSGPGSPSSGPGPNGSTTSTTSTTTSPGAPSTTVAPAGSGSGSMGPSSSPGGC